MKDKPSKKSEPSGIGEIIDAMKRTRKLGSILQQAAIWEHWEELAGPRHSRHARPHSIRDGVLKIEADSAVWVHRFTAQKWGLVKRVNRMAKKRLITDVFVVLLPDGESLDENPPPPPPEEESTPDPEAP